MRTLYFDNAATTYPKPPAVYLAVLRAMREAGGNPGRSGHRLSLLAEQTVYSAREAVASLFGSTQPEGVVFTHNATYALNFALKSLVKKGAHILISPFEHNAVLRPIVAMTQQGLCSYSTFSVPVDLPPGPAWEAQILASLERAILPSTRIICVTHTSNLCGITLPLQAIGNFCKAHRLYFIVDASQSAGCLPIHAPACHIDALCFPAHKGLYGIAGCGGILFSPRLCAQSETLGTIIEGGTGVYSQERTMPALFPERMEAGTLPTPAIAALKEGIRFVQTAGIESLHAEECALSARLKEQLASLNGCTVYAPLHPGSTVLFSHKEVSPASLASYLDTQGICVREGLHCAPLAHATLGTGENGAVRVSFGAFHRTGDCDLLFSAIRCGIEQLSCERTIRKG